MSKTTRHFGMRQDEKVSLVVFVLLSFLLLIGVYEGLWSLSAVLEYMPYFIMAGMVGVLIWGFRERIEHAIKQPSATTPQYEYVVSLAQEAEETKMREIHVRLLSGETLKRQAHFFIVRIGVPIGTQNAEEIKLLYRHPTSNDLFELQNIPSTGVPYIIMQWASPDKFLSDVPEKFATALVDAKEGKIQHLNLTSGESHLSLVPLVFFFTVSGSNAVYFPSFAMKAYVMPIKFQTELYIEAKGRPQKLLTVLDVDAQRWDHVAVSEASTPLGIHRVN